jgi:glutamate synthase (ferredoxin)
MVEQFVRVVPRDFKRMLESIKQAKKDGLDGDEAVMTAFVRNKTDVARVSGN